jgi:TatD DNase family protein
MNIIDTHTHLYLNQFKEDIDDVVASAKEIGVKKFIFPAIDSSHFDSMHSLKNKYPNEYLI